MLFAFFIICQLTVLTVGNPFHKYPFVFLLDVGNEELEKTNTEQIRISVPGGSLALRYPAIGDGDTIGHVRVSGIDFGTDLKANIVDGGPGYKYVVLVFMGNAGVSYDAVVTIQTVPVIKNKSNGNVASESVEMSGKSNTYQVSEENEEDRNDSAEDMSDSSENQLYNQKVSTELMQSSSNVYSYAQNKMVEDNDEEVSSDNVNDDDENGKDIHVKYSEDSDQSYSQDASDNDYVEGDDNSQEDDYNDMKGNFGSIGNSKAEKYIVNNGYITDDDYGNEDNDEPIRVVDNNLYGKYNALRPHFNNDIKIYSQEAFNDAQEQSSKYVYGPEDPVEIDQMFNDEEIHNDAEKYKDNNNNYFDSDDNSAVAY